MNSRHRDRLSFFRIVSGIYRKGLKVRHSRSEKSGRLYNLSAAFSVFGDKREPLEEAFSGDIIAINNPGLFAIGDTLYESSGSSSGGGGSALTGDRIRFPPIPSFSPEKFAYLRNTDASKYKAFTKGLVQLIEEGAIQLLKERSGGDGAGSGSSQGGGLSGLGPKPLLAAVGSLQFDVVLHRLKSEYNVDASLEPVETFTLARWASAGWPVVAEADRKGKLFNVKICEDRWGRAVLLFRNEWKCEALEKEVTELGLVAFSAPPEM
jgi:peptide chain release factor 3